MIPRIDCGAPACKANPTSAVDCAARLRLEQWARETHGRLVWVWGWPMPRKTPPPPAVWS